MSRHVPFSYASRKELHSEAIEVLKKAKENEASAFNQRKIRFIKKEKL